MRGLVGNPPPWSIVSLAMLLCAASIVAAEPPRRVRPRTQPINALPAQGAFPAGPGAVAGSPPVPCDLDELAANIKAAVHNKCVGYQFAIYHDGRLFRKFHGGMARTDGDAPARVMSSSDRLELASVSKTFNAIATIKVLALKGKTVNAKIHPYLPEGWAIDDTVRELTFRDLLSHTSKLPKRSVRYKPGTVNQPIKDALNKGRIGKEEYNNINYDILRVCVPYLVDSASMKAAEGDEETHEIALANCFAGLVRKHVFQPAGIGNRITLKDWHPSGSDYKFARYYKFATAGSGGEAAPNRSRQPGRGGWKMNAVQVAQVASALNAGRILTPSQFTAMKNGKLGISRRNVEYGAAYGHSGSNPGTKGSSTGYLILPGNVQVALLLNSKSNECGRPVDIIANAFNEACRSPDLVVTDFKALGSATYEDGKLKVPFSMTVRNQGKESTKHNFANAVRYGDSYRWTGLMDALGAGGSRTVLGIVSIPDPGKSLAGKRIKLVAYCDAPIAAGDTSIPPYGRVKESNEPNNFTRSFEVTAPGTSGGLAPAVQATPKRAASRVTPPRRAP